MSSLKSSSMQHDVHLVNYGPISSQIDHKAGYALGRGYLVIDRSLPRHCPVWELSVFSSYNFNPFTVCFQFMKVNCNILVA